MSVFVGICVHGKVVAALVEYAASDEDLFKFADSHHIVERRASVRLGGNCDECHQQYMRNLEVMGIKP